MIGPEMRLNALNRTPSEENARSGVIVTVGNGDARMQPMNLGVQIRICLALAGLAVATVGANSAEAQGRAPLVDPRSVAPYVPTPWHVVDRMLDLVQVTEHDMVYDLGSGDGRILVRAAKAHGARGVGLEINHDLVVDARLAIGAANVEDRVKIVEQDIFEADLSPASVVTLFLMTSANRRLKPKLLEELRPGTRIACYKWEIPGWNPVKSATVEVSGAGQPIYMYEVGAHQ